MNPAFINVQVIPSYGGKQIFLQSGFLLSLVEIINRELYVLQWSRGKASACENNIGCLGSASEMSHLDRDYAINNPFYFRERTRK